MDSFSPRHLSGITNQLYATKHQVIHPAKIGEGLFPDAFLGTGRRVQPSSYL